MPTLPEFRLEAFFARWEFTARYHLTASDAESMPMSDLLALAGAEDRKRWDELRLGYTETRGLPALREAIAGTYDRLGADDVLCFGGADEALYLAMQVLLDPGDHAVVLTPNYQAAETVPLSICDVTGVPLRAEDGWALDLDAIRAALRPNTRLVSVSFPNNPTGAVPDPATWAGLARLCDERGIRLFSDEVYRGIELDPARTLEQAADLSENALSLNVMSKAYGQPGLRIGWIACRDRGLLGRLERAKHYTTICNSGPSEILALIALHARTEILRRNRDIVAGNVPIFDAFFAEFPDLFSWAPPQGGCVCYPRYHGADGVEAMCAGLLAAESVLLLPASIYRSDLTATPTDHFRIGVGRRNPEPALAHFTRWLHSRPPAR